ncbi:MAG: hypothetical protein ACTHMM_13525 [Agriterribacter sp.]
MKIATIISLNVLLVVSCATAQVQLSLEAKAGMQGLQYKLENSESRPQIGGGIGIGYAYALNDRWQLLTGLSGELFRTNATLKDGAVFSSYQVDETGSAFQYNVTTKGYRESQRFFAIGIPVKLQYHTTGHVQWYANGGFRFVLPVKARLQASADELTVSGYYPDYNIEVKNMEQHGFGTIQNWKSNTTPLLNPGIALSGATGVSLRLTNKLRLYGGLFLDYGLTNMRNGNWQNASLVKYAPNNVNNTEARGAMNISRSARLLAYGLQLKLTR